MGSKLWLITVLLLAVSVCYKALEAKYEDVKDKDVSKEGDADDYPDEMNDDEDEHEDEYEDDGEDDDEDDPDEIDIPGDELDELDELDYEDPSPWLFSRRRTPSQPRPPARRSWSWRRPRVPSRPRPPRRRSWSWRRPRRPPPPAPRPRPRPRPPVLPPRPPVPRPRPRPRPPPNPPVPTRRPGFLWSRRPRPPVPRPRPPVPPPPGGNSQLCFEQICSSNPSNDLRGSDPLGSGAYGASRKGRRHKGIDIKCSASSNVYAPFPGKIVRESRPYAGNGQPHNTGILMSGTGSWKGYSVKMHYVVKRVSNGASVGGGSYIGSMTNMKAYFRAGMTNHIHVQLYKNGRIINPTSYVC